MALSSPGVEVRVIDESFYTPAEPGTVPLIIVTSAENKPNGAGDGIAPGTLKANAGQTYLITSQKDLVDTFGDPVFKTDTNNNPIHAGEQNEYGLQAAYSLLGVSNRAYVVRADLDLDQLNPSVDAPASAPKNGTYWLDTQTTNWGIFEWDARPVTAGGQKFVNKVPTIITDATKVDALTGGPVAAMGKVGSYAIVAVDTSSATPALTDSHPMSLWYKNDTGMWVQVGSQDWEDSFTGTPSLAVQPHTQVPQWKTGGVSPALSGSVWIKTTEPNLGARWRTSRYNSTTQLFDSVEAPLYLNNETALFALDKAGGGQNLAVGSLYTKYNLSDNGVNFKLYRRKATAPLAVKSSKITADTFAGVAGTLTAVNPTSIVGLAIEESESYTGLASTSVTGIGAGGTFDVTRVGTSYTVATVNNAGNNYAAGDTLVISGTLLDGSTPANDLTLTVNSVSQNYVSVAPNSTSGVGVNATFNISRSGATYSATVALPGSGYAGGDTVTFLGSQLGGVDGVNDLVITVSTVDVGGEILSISTVAGTAAGNGTIDSVSISSGTANVTGAPVTYNSLAVTPVTGTGTGAVVNVTKTGTTVNYTNTNTTITIVSGGTGYQSGDQLRVVGSLLGGTDGVNDLTFTVSGETTVYMFTMAESLAGNATLGNAVTVTFSITSPAASNSDVISAAINTAGLVNVEASVDSQNRLVVTHELGGDIHFADGTNSPLNALGFVPFNATTGVGVVNLYSDDDGAHDFVASLWEPLVYVANEDPPTSLTENGQIWYSSVIDEIDLMIHNGTTWVGYSNEVSDADSLGPFVTAVAPETQRDGTVLETGDIWIDTSDIENFPTIYKYNKDLLKWILVDKTDQSTEDGVLFADARYNTAGANSDVAGSIEELLVSDYLDPDAPDPALYPKGMLLWNLRRSGFNVKEFKLNYVDVNADNSRQNDQAMADYYPHRWVTVSANQADGSGTFGRKAQRAVVVQALQAMVNSNQQIRDDESRVFNLMACPGYPELIGEMINLNFDRGLTAFIVGDTPARLTPDATSILRWGTNELLAPEDNDIGAASFDEYMGMFYPWGFSSDNFGNNVVVPPSHMILRTIALNDQVAYPWFAPAGVRRGGITNATAVGYVDSQEGEFKTVALNNGQRDTLYEVKINPITFFTGTGLVNYGQKTRAKAASALDRINVARLVIYLRRQLNLLAKPYIFEPNDKITRDEIKAAVESLLLELVGQRALYDYVVVCDESNNTPNRIDRSELWIDIAIEPVKAVEFIYIPLRLKNTGEISGLA